jgi:acyl carrier protein
VLERVKAVVSETFHVTRALAPGDGPAQIPTWDSLGNLRLALALEDEFHVTLADDALYGVKSVGDVAGAVVTRLERAREGVAI